MEKKDIEEYVSDPQLVPDEWKKKEVIPFPDKIYYDEDDREFMRVLYWGKSGELKSCYCMANMNHRAQPWEKLRLLPSIEVLNGSRPHREMIFQGEVRWLHQIVVR
jgi:hypothetical protein